MSFYLVTDKRDGSQYRYEALSKTKLKRRLPRFDEDRGYCSFWSIDEVTEKDFRNKHKAIPLGSW